MNNKMNEYTPKLVLDSRINDISDKVDVAVESSAAQSTYQTFKSVNNSNSSITWNVNIPSENIAVDRRILMNTKIKFTVNITGDSVDANAFEWGSTDGVGQFPFNGLFQLSGFKNVGLDQTVQGRGCITPDQIVVKQYDSDDVLVDINSVVSTNATNYFIVQVSIAITEPFFVFIAV